MPKCPRCGEDISKPKCAKCQKELKIGRSMAKEVVALLIATVAAWYGSNYLSISTYLNAYPQLQLYDKPIVTAIFVVVIFYILVSLKVPKKKTTTAPAAK